MEQPDHGGAPVLLDLYDTALPEVYGYLVSRCGSVALAEDLASETFLAAVDALRRGGPATLTTAWLIGVARHKLVDHWRRTERQDRLLRAVESETVESEDPWEAHLDVLRAQTVLAQLSANHRAVLTLRYLDGLPVPAVAECVDRSVGATEVLLVRARKAFRAIYEAGEER